MGDEQPRDRRGRRRLTRERRAELLKEYEENYAAKADLNRPFLTYSPTVRTSSRRSHRSSTRSCAICGKISQRSVDHIASAASSGP